MSGQTSEEKTLPPSAKKLREARKKGQFPRSKEMVTAAVTVSGFAYLFFRAGAVFDDLRDAAIAAGSMVDQPFAAVAGPLANRLLADIGLALVPFIALLVAAALLSNILINGGVLVAVDPVLPKLERLDPMEGFKRMFALRNMIELLKALLKMSLVGVIVTVLIADSLQALVEQPSCGIGCAGPVLRELLKPLLITACGFFLIVGGLDVGIQKWLFRRDMRMTRTEQKRERKEMEGDPLIKRQHRSERRSAARGAVRTGLRNATFVVRAGDIVVALRYSKPDAMVPILVARGTGEGALLLLEESRAAGLPLVFDVPAAQAIARLKVGQMVTKEMFPQVIGCMQQAGLL